jgi:hypothetical protein
MMPRVDLSAANMPPSFAFTRRHAVAATLRAMPFTFSLTRQR